MYFLIFYTVLLSNLVVTASPNPDKEKIHQAIVECCPKDIECCEKNIHNFHGNITCSSGAPLEYWKDKASCIEEKLYNTSAIEANVIDVCCPMMMSHCCMSNCRAAWRDLSLTPVSRVKLLNETCELNLVADRNTTDACTSRKECDYLNCTSTTVPCMDRQMFSLSNCAIYCFRHQLHTLHNGRPDYDELLDCPRYRKSVNRPCIGKKLQGKK